MERTKMLLVAEDVLPTVFGRVVEAKRLLAVGRAKNLSEAAKLAGISRSALYKYKDNVFLYNQNIPADGVAPVSISARLESSGGVEELLERLGDVDGVVEVKLVSSR